MTIFSKWAVYVKKRLRRLKVFHPYSNKAESNERLFYIIMQDTRQTPGYFPPSNFVENVFLEETSSRKVTLCAFYIDLPIFKKSVFFQKNSSFGLKRRFYEMLSFHTHFTANIKLDSFSWFWERSCFYSKKSTFFFKKNLLL